MVGASTPGVASGEGPHGSEPEGRRQAVLVVDDEPDMLHIMGLFVAEALPGVEVLAAPSGTAALEVMARQPLDMILCDYRMPDLDGIEVLARACDLVPGARRVLMTAFADSTLPDVASQRVELSAFIPKVTDPGVLRRQLVAAMAASPPVARR